MSGGGQQQGGGGGIILARAQSPFTRGGNVLTVVNNTDSDVSLDEGTLCTLVSTFAPNGTGTLTYSQ